ncbi:MAG TPA: tetratricopeptide repeat protein, partial [Candidatus Binataceae bacterium]|nr:tetratricopeptide repeat protein [Candidatus Binataceae bacterium]
DGQQAAYLANAKLTCTAYGYFSDMVAQGKIPVKNLTGTLSILGQCLQAQGQEEQAEQIYQQVVKADAASPDANAGLARIAQAKKDYAKALTLWTNVETTAAESDPLWYEAKYNIAVVDAAQGNRNGACTKLAQTRAEHPTLGSPEMKAQWNALQTKLCLKGQ